MVKTPSKTLILEEFLKLPETQPASEYIDSQIIQKPMPQGEHSTIQGELIIGINAVVNSYLAPGNLNVNSLTKC